MRRGLLNYFSSSCLKVSIFDSSHDVISLSCSVLALKICWSDESSLISCFDVVGPIPGKPSRMNCFLSFCDLKFFDGLNGVSVFGFSYFLATRIRKFEVSSSSSVKISGTWKSSATDRNIPLIAFSWMLIFWFL